MTARVRTLSLRTTSYADAHRALRSACFPFGSLSDEIADLAISYLTAGSTIDAGIALLRATRAVSDVEPVPPAATEWSDVTLGAWRVQLITPTSGTVIELWHSAGRGWVLTVDFGEHGSDSRADQILEHDTAAPDLAWQATTVRGPADPPAGAPTDPLCGFDPADIVVGPGGQSLAKAAAQETAAREYITTFVVKSPRGAREKIAPLIERAGHTHRIHPTMGASGMNWPTMEEYQMWQTTMPLDEVEALVAADLGKTITQPMKSPPETRK